jgi:hypothetical protein
MIETAETEIKLLEAAPTVLMALRASSIYKNEKGITFPPSPPPHNPKQIGDISQNSGVIVQTLNIEHTFNKSLPQEPENRNPKKLVRVIVTTIAAVAGLAAILTYFGLKPEPKAIGIDKHDIPTATPLMLPKIEGIRIYQSQVASPSADAPFAIEVTVQVESAVQPFAILFTCDQDVAQGMPRLGAGGPMTNVRIGTWNNDPKTCYIGIGGPAIAPANPLIVTLSSSKAFRILKVQRANF